MHLEMNLRTLSEKAKKNLNLIIKIFFIWLLLQFILQVFVTFQLWRDWWIWTIVRARKELILLVWLSFLLRYLLKQKRLRSFIETFPAKRFLRAFLITLWVVLIVSLFLTKSGLTVTLMSIRYTFSGFFIFLLFFALGRIFFTKNDVEKQNKLLYRYSKIIKTLLFLGILRWGMIRLVPRTMTFFGYNEYNFEGNVGVRPPVTYRTQLNQWFVRNQFIFERPISRGFFLIALRPLFFVFMIKNKWTKNIFVRWWLYGLNVFSTFSRAAWWVRILITFLLLLLQYRKQFWKLSLYLFLPLLVLFVWAAYIGKDQIIAREYSNTWHKELLLEAIQKIKEKPLFGQWAGTAWPVTHQIEAIKEYNPENQFLQIRIEYWVFWFIGRMWMFIRLLFLWVPAYNILSNKKYSKAQRHAARIMFACALGLLWLAWEGMVLHSFIDRMIVYPFMAIYGLAYANFLHNNPRVLLEKKTHS